MTVVLVMPLEAACIPKSDEQGNVHVGKMEKGDSQPRKP
jgi:hypothetical protein